jgi:hypothetical protein
MLFGSVFSNAARFTHAEYADMVFLRVCNGNTLAACSEYNLWFPKRRVPDSRVSASVYSKLRELVHFPEDIFLLNVQTNKMWMK